VIKADRYIQWESRIRSWCWVLCFGFFLTTISLVANQEVDRSLMLKAAELVKEDKLKEALRVLDRALADRELREIWGEALIEKIRLLADTGEVRAAIREATQASRSRDFQHMETQLHWWTVILYAGPAHNLKRAITRAEALARGPAHDEYVERAAYSVGIMLMWDGNRLRARRALEEYLRRYENGRYAEAARKYLKEL